MIVFCGCVLSRSAGFAQVNHGYPRTAIYNWGGAPMEWYAKFDLVDFSSTSTGLVQQIKDIDPNTVVLSTSGWTAYGHPFVITPLPEPWFARDSKGNKIDTGGGNLLVDLTNMCDLYNGQRYNQKLPEVLVNRVDLSVFDGIASDWLWSKPHGVSDIDLDKNGVNDYQEHGENWVISVWQGGLETLLTNLRNRMPSDKLILINSGLFHEFGWSQTNGVLLEHSSGFYGGWKYFFDLYQRWMKEARSPHILLLDGNPSGDDPYCPSPSKNYFKLMRFLLTLTLLGDGYFSFSDIESNEHFYDKYYDEFDLDLGYPTTGAQTLYCEGSTWDPHCIWIRFFDNGVSIFNPKGEPQIVTDNDLRTLSGYDGPYYRFRGGQDSDFNNGQLFTEIELFGAVVNSKTIGDGIILLKEPLAVVSGIIIDDFDVGTSPGSNPPELIGNWIHNDESGGAFYALTVRGYKNWYGYGYSLPGDGQNKAIYRPTIGVAGNYEVFEWHGWLGGSPDDIQEGTNVPFTITYTQGTKVSGTIDQSTNYGKWNSLGTYYFDKGTSGKVTLNNNANGIVIADAFKFVFRGVEQDDILPNEPRELRSENRTANSLTLSWLAPLQASDGDTASAYQIFRDNSYIGTSIVTSYTDSDLSENTTYNYSVYALDNVGNRSSSAAMGSFTTLTDTIPPSLVSVRVLGSTSLDVIFSEAVEQASAENINNYSIENDVTVFSATLLDNLSEVRLTTSEHVIGAPYTLIVNNVRDRALSPNAIAPNSSVSYTGGTGDSLTITISVDDVYDLYVNGAFIGTADHWEDAQSYKVPSISGKNVIAVKCSDLGGPGGLVAEIDFGGNHFVSNEDWKLSMTEQSSWETVVFDDISWQKATSYGFHGEAQPWAQYGNVQGISTDSGVHWIWSSDNENNNLVYFRFTLRTEGDITPPNPPVGVTVTTSQ